MKSTIGFIVSGILIFSLTGIMLTSCKKDDVKGKNDYTSQSNLSQDEIAVEEITNESLDDVEGLLGNDNSELKSGRVPCNATVDSTEVINDTITIYITYDGISCNGKRIRTGQVEIRKRAGTNFGMEGASVNIRHINFTVTRVGSGHSMTINSSKTFTNVTGGYRFMLGHNGFDTLVHRVQGTINIMFDDNSSRTWTIARQLTYTGTRGDFALTVEGFGSQDNYDNLVTWGINRNGAQFYSIISDPVIYRQSCDWDPVWGSKIQWQPGVDKSAIVTFGYNDNNQLINLNANECPTRYRVDWSNGNFSGTRFIPLP